MYQRFEQWSEQNLGQWHYVLGYTLNLVDHNWPIMLALLLSLTFGVMLYRRPSRECACWLFSALLLGLAYEYQKHVAVELHKAINFLFGLELAGLNRPMHLFVGPVMRTALLLCCLAMLAQAVRLTVMKRSLLTAPAARYEGDLADERL